MSKTQSQIEAEIGEMAEKMAKSTKDSKQLLFDTIMELGPEGLKKALPDLSEEDQVVLKSALDEMAKAQSEDAAKLTPKKDMTPANVMKQESFEGSDDEDEKLMEEKNAKHPQQGGPADKPEGWEGQVIKAIEQSENLVKALFNDKCQIVEASKPEETKESVMNQISWKIDDLKRMKDMSWLISDELPEVKEMMEKKFSKIKSEIKSLAEKFSSLKKSEPLEKKQGVPAGVDPEKHERCVQDVKAQGHDKSSAYAICNSSMKKGEAEKDTEKEEPEVEMPAKQAVKEHKRLVNVLESESHADDKEEAKKQKKELKEYKEEMAKGDSKKTLETLVELEEAEHGKDIDGDGKVAEKLEKEKEVKKPENKVEKSISWAPKSSIAANTLGRNTHWDVDAYIVKSEEEKQDTIKKGAYFNDNQGETLQKSQTEKADINDLIEKGMDYSTDEIKRIEGVRDHKIEGSLVKSFHDIEIAKAMGMSEEEYKKLMGE